MEHFSPFQHFHFMCIRISRKDVRRVFSFTGPLKVCGCVLWNWCYVLLNNPLNWLDIRKKVEKCFLFFLFSLKPQPTRLRQILALCLMRNVTVLGFALPCLWIIESFSQKKYQFKTFCKLWLFQVTPTSTVQWDDLGTWKQLMVTKWFNAIAFHPVNYSAKLKESDFQTGSQTQFFFPHLFLSLSRSHSS